MRRILQVVLIALVAIIAGACGASGSTPEIGDPITITPDGRAETSVQRPSEPASPTGDYRPDSAALVANTGNPQLVEVFSYD